MIRRFLYLLFLIIAAGCGSSSTSPQPVDPGPEVSALGSVAHFTYQFQTTTTTDSGTFDLNFPETYSVPLYIKPDGEVTVLAREFPRMVYRLCPLGSTDTTCNINLDLPALGNGVDLVMDLCGEGVANADCGPKDGSLYDGSVNSEGRLVIPALDVRIRIFLLGGTGPDGYTADVTDSGILSNLPRLQVVVQTDPEIKTGILSDIGTRILNKEAKLVAGGIIPAGMAQLSGAHYISAMTGTFDIDPLLLLQ